MGGAVGAQRLVLRVMSLKGRVRALARTLGRNPICYTDYRVPELLSIRLIGSPHPFPRKRMCLPPPHLGPGGRHTRLGGKRWEDSNQTTVQKLWYSVKYNRLKKNLTSLSL